MLSIDKSEIILLEEVHKFSLNSPRIIYTVDNPNYLVVYDLYHTALSLPSFDFSKYNCIFDIYIIERLAYLGLYHKKYYGQNHKIKSPIIQLIEQLRDPFNTDKELNVNTVRNILNYVGSIINELQINNGWSHYLTIELPFALSLANVTRSGCTFDRDQADIFFHQSPTTRNIIVNELFNYGVEEATDSGLKKWCLQHSDANINLIGSVYEDVIKYKKYADLHPVFKLYKLLDKLDRAHRFLKNIDKKTALHPQYMTIGTETCRCTSKNPNINGIPKEIRPIIIPHSGNRGIVEIDYCQMEVGIVAALSEDSLLISDFNTGDVYTQLANVIEVDREMAKQLFLSVLYGVSERTLTSWLGFSDYTKTRKIVNKFFKRYSSLNAFMKDLEIKGASNGFGVAITGLRRRRSNRGAVNKPNNSILRWEKNWYKNFPIQCSAASVFKSAIINISNSVDPDEYNIIAPVYDAIVFEAPLKRLDKYVEITSRNMIAAMKDRFPVLDQKVDVNAINTKCWNSQKIMVSFEEFIANPLKSIPMVATKNKNWFSL